MTEQQRFVKKPVEVEAIQFTEQSKDRCFNFVRRTCHADFEDGRPILKVQTIHGDTAIVRLGDWIVKENAPGAYYPVKPDIFEVSYAPAAALSHAEGEAVAEVTTEPDYWSRGHFYEGRKKDIKILKGLGDIPVGTKLYTRPAPAGELVTRCTAGLGCDEKGHCDAAATGQGDMCDRRTMAHEQPVSDPDGLPEPGRREAEQAYINGAFDYARDPIGSRDWVLFWNGWQARDKSAPSPDEREIAALALERHADNLIVMAERDGRNNDRESQQTWEEAAYFAKQEADRLRAGKEGEPS